MPSVRACEIIIERAWGKAPQPVTGENGGPIEGNFAVAARMVIEAAMRSAKAIDVEATESGSSGGPTG